MDALSAIVRSLRLRDASLSSGHLTGRWGIHTRGATKPIFHGIVAGRALLFRDGDVRAIVLEAGDVVVLPRGDAHRLVSEEGAAVVAVTSLAGTSDPSAKRVEHGTRGAATQIVCGVFGLEHPMAPAIVDLLPAAIAVRAGDPRKQSWVEATLRLLDDEVQRAESELTITNLADSLFAHALSDDTQHEAVSLLAAARDEQIGRALALIHAHPDRAWAVVSLAAAVGMSRTRFFERFTELVGEPPARYVTRWRMQAAATLMRQPSFSVAEVAERVGYSSEDALSKVFKRYLGVSPSSYRRAQGAAAS